jgi:hypothetical protein
LRRVSWPVLTVLLLVLLVLLLMLLLRPRRRRLLPRWPIVVARLLGLRRARQRQPRADPQRQQVRTELES